jgi:protein TonB
MRITLAESATGHRRPSPWLAGSLAAHAAAVSLMLMRVTAPPPLTRYVPERLPPYVEMPQEAAPTPVRDGSPGSPKTAAPPAPTLPSFDIPPTAPPAIPEHPWAQAAPSPGFDADAFRRRGLAGGASAPLGPALAGGVFEASMVERPVWPLAGNPAPRYPTALARAGVEGEVIMRFVVDTAGRVERGSIRLVRGTHVLFERAVSEVLPLLRFQPAEAGGARVRQAVEQPFRFELSRRHDEEDRS